MEYLLDFNYCDSAVVIDPEPRKQGVSTEHNAAPLATAQKPKVPAGQEDTHRAATAALGPAKLPERTKSRPSTDPEATNKASPTAAMTRK